VPVRTCIGCRTKRPQPVLVRVVRTPDGALVVGRSLPGRGAWLCAATASECAGQAARRRAFGRALRADVTPEAVESLRTLLANRASMEGR
jgi:predicted RNA-binding protein YlxR (DUF448 family)